MKMSELQFIKPGKTNNAVNSCIHVRRKGNRVCVTFYGIDRYTDNPKRVAFAYTKALGGRLYFSFRDEFDTKSYKLYFASKIHDEKAPQYAMFSAPDTMTSSEFDLRLAPIFDSECSLYYVNLEV